MKKVLFIDRDGTIILEPKDDYQVDSLEKLEFYPSVFKGLGKISLEFDYELVIITNQDGLGTESYPEDSFWPAQNKMIQTFKNEGIEFDEVFIDKTFAKDGAETRKPRTGLLNKYFSEAYDLTNSFVIGDRMTDMELAKNLGAKGIFMDCGSDPGSNEVEAKAEEIKSFIALSSTDWNEIYEFLRLENRTALVERQTNETEIRVKVDLDGSGSSKIDTGLKFFDHMLEQIAKHGSIDLEIYTKGDLEVDEHHTIEDTAIALGEALKIALGDKLGIERYGYCLPMDDCLAQVALDFGGRNWIEWDASFKREKVGDMPTEMFFHFFKSLSDAALCNLNIKAEGVNEHHKIEAIFKALARAIKMAKKRDLSNMVLPSTKGML
ncbi:MAG: imidazoleglycerol-phosphate dehydratase/histidinol-phosphatase [Parvicellaceae bacterium]|jgi:imidazoleglycerol-phosphate dehydratase/histidinol-phosphatase